MARTGVTRSGDWERLDLTLAGWASMDWQPPLEEIGQTEEAAAIRRFSTETAPDGNKWKPSQRALAQGGQTLTDTGDLKGSIGHEVGDHVVEIGTNLNYGPAHQHGPQESPNPNANYPPRPFLGFSDEGVRSTEEICTRYVRSFIK